MISNFAQLKKKLIGEFGITPISDTDTELIVLLTKYYMDSEGLNTKDAFKKTFSMMEGSNSVMLINKDEDDRIYLAKNSGSLLIGVGEDCFCISSEATAFQSVTPHYVDCPDHQIIIVTKDGIIK
jgi:glucosamine--fructose-6-phosphate aminotransferase (isomerizing)